MDIIKKVFGWIFLFIGCSYLGSIPFSVGYPYPIEDVWLLGGRITGALLIVCLFTYFGWKTIKRPAPESNAIFAIPIIIFILFGFMAGSSNQYAYYDEYEVPEFEYEPIKALDFPASVLESESTGKFIEKYRDAQGMFYKISYDSELKAEEHTILAHSYYEKEQINKARDKYHEAAGLYSKAEEQNLEAKALFEVAYEIAPTEYYKELCLLYIDAAQSDSELMNYASSATKHMENACEFYGQGFYNLGDTEVEKQGEDSMRYNIKAETYNILMENINEIEYY